MFIYETPQPVQEPADAFDTFARPHQTIFRRGFEHHIKPRRVGAVFLDQVLRIDAVVLRLRHRAQAVGLDRLAVGAQHGAGALALVVVLELDIGGGVGGGGAAPFPSVEDFVWSPFLPWQAPEMLLPVPDTVPARPSP